RPARRVLGAGPPPEVGRDDDRRGGRPGRAASAPPPAAAVRRRVGPHRARARAAARRDRRALRPPHRTCPDARAESGASGAARGATAAEPLARAPSQPPLRRPDPRAPAPLPVLRQRPRSRHARLRLLGREPAARAFRPRRGACLDRLRPPLVELCPTIRSVTVLQVRFLVAGAGSWGTAFTRVLLDRGHEVVLACRTPEQASAIAETGRNPRYLPKVDLRGAETVALADAPADVDVVVVAVPSPSFTDVVAALPGDAPV